MVEADPDPSREASLGGSGGRRSAKLDKYGHAGGGVDGALRNLSAWADHWSAFLQQRGDWNLYWKSGRFRPSEYAGVKPYQKMNHFPRLGCITRKDSLVRIMRRMAAVHGSQVYGFVPEAYILPNEYTKFVETYSEQDECSRAVWICKPADSSRGRNIFLLRNLEDLRYDSQFVIQRYIERPFLVGGYKCDLRVYVLVVSVHPLKAYIYRDGLVRFGTSEYDLGSLSNKFSHLTNSSINKLSPTLESDKCGIGLPVLNIHNVLRGQRLRGGSRVARKRARHYPALVGWPSDLPGVTWQVCPGCKWTFKQLEAHFVAGRLDDKLLWSRIINLVNATLLNLVRLPVRMFYKPPLIASAVTVYFAVDYPSVQILAVPRNPGVSGQQNYFELFGFDVVIDEKMRPWLVNCSPALQVDCPVDESVKKPLVEDLLDVIYHPNVHDLVFPSPVRSSCEEPFSACPRTIGQFSLIFPFNAEVEALALQGKPIASGGKASASQADALMRSIVSHLRRVDKNIRQYAAESQRYRQDVQGPSEGTVNQASLRRDIFSVELYLHFAASDQPVTQRTDGTHCRRKNDVSQGSARMRKSAVAHGQASPEAVNRSPQ
ncbi:Tubulin tyrosine ligase-like, member [Perkinsus olseni]|uniref:Tubulin tyrosine ligase-like, member n=1 Tax=Perkinsus olseni TaxID=32597 RepID=A0A7J6M5I8_PEROL|nr:Tubulin tyrosine ligase-like, member [Perkinsus olseni]